MSPRPPLSELFPPGPFRFHLTLKRGDAREFFGPQDPTGRLLAERAKWIDADPTRYADLQPEGEPLLAELGELAAREWGIAGVTSVRELGRRLEPDMLLLAPDAAGAYRLRGGALCFPTGWALEEKMGQTLDVIHGVVPGLNAALAAPINQFLSRLKPGAVFFRDNWGIVTTDELNLHTSRRAPAPALPVQLERLWLRLEYQALLLLPRTRGVLFGIRLGLHRLDDVARDPGAAAGLRNALATMPPEMAAYKRLDGIRSKLIECV
ncbi:MAG TPA: DUF3445 domain-containing protein [Opitutaceae bacterium]|nr:DUF3445 domain-containing protein [Opitutaceae bacterium]HND61583.1 DUF3445 domain-containing protein [Opitutaceae bacterium]